MKKNVKKYFPSTQVKKLACYALSADFCFICMALFLGRRIETLLSGAATAVPLVVFLLLLAIFLKFISELRTNIEHQGESPPSKQTFYLLSTAFFVLAAVIGESLIVAEVERIHFLKYGTFSFFLFFVLKPRHYLSSLALSFVITSLLGCAEETAQLWIPRRVFDWRDLFLNCVGSAFGVSYVALTLWWLGIHRQSNAPH